MKAQQVFKSIGRWLLKLCWSICKWLFKLLGKVLLFLAWAICELLAAVFAAIAKWLKGIITAKQ